MPEKLVKHEEWTSLKRQREIPLLIHIRTEVLEYPIFFEGFFANKQKNTTESCKKMNCSINNEDFKFINVLLDDYEAVCTNKAYAERRIL